MKTFKFIGAKLIEMVLFLAAAKFGLQVIYKLIFGLDYKTFMEQSQIALSDPTTHAEFFTTSQYMSFVYSGIIAFIIAVVLFVVIPVLVFKSSIGDVIFRINTISINKPVWKRIVCQPALWFAFALNYKFVFIAIGVVEPAALLNMLQYAFMCVGFACFFIAYNDYQGVSWTQNQTPDNTPTRHRTVNAKPKVKKR